MTENEKKLINIIQTLCSDVIEASDSSIRDGVRYAVFEVKELGFEIKSPIADKNEEE